MSLAISTSKPLTAREQFYNEELMREVEILLKSKYDIEILAWTPALFEFIGSVSGSVSDLAEVNADLEKYGTSIKYTKSSSNEMRPWVHMKKHRRILEEDTNFLMTVIVLAFVVNTIAVAYKLVPEEKMEEIIKKLTLAMS